MSENTHESEYAPRDPRVLARFWESVDASDTDGCWLWTGKTRGKGYGYLYVGRWYSKSGYMDAHRYAAWMFMDDFHPVLQVCHSCDQPLCVAVDHLFMGTGSDNVKDMVAKGRGMWRGNCKRGHDLSIYAVPANKGTGRRCGICLNDYREARRVA